MEAIRAACTLDAVVFTNHARERMGARSIKYEDIASSLSNGRIIEQYVDDMPFPSCLVLGYSNDKPLHVVVSLNNGMLWIITTYSPSRAKWNADYMTRKVVNKP